MKKPTYNRQGRYGLGPRRSRDDHRLGGGAFPEPGLGGGDWGPALDDSLLEDYLGSGRGNVPPELVRKYKRTRDAIRRRLWGLSCRYRVPGTAGYQPADYRPGSGRTSREGKPLTASEYHLVYWSFGPDGVKSGACSAEWIASLLCRPAEEVALAVHDRFKRDYEWFKKLANRAGQSRLMTPEEAQRAQQSLRLEA